MHLGLAGGARTGAPMVAVLLGSAKLMASCGADDGPDGPMVAGGTPPATNGVEGAAASCDAACSECALDGGPGGSEAPDTLMADTRMAGLTVSDSGNDERSDIGARALWWMIICRSDWARSRES